MQKRNLSGLRFKKGKIYSILIFSIIILSFWLSGCQSNKEFDPRDYFSKAALKSERENFLIKIINETIKSNLSKPLTDSTESSYQSAFWAMELIQYKNGFTDSVLTLCFNDLDKRSTEFQRSFLEVIYSLYQNKFMKEIEYFAGLTTDPKLFAMCINYLKNSGSDVKEIIDNYITKNPEMKENPIIVVLTNDIADSRASLPPLRDLFNHNFNNHLVIYSIQRINRDYPGLVIIKTPDGKFLRDNSGEIFNVPQLARAVTDLSGYITNGNTPEGIFSIQGIDFSKSIFIGPSPNLQLVLPYEVNPIKYFHSDIKDTVWNTDSYKSLLPESWENYFPIYEAYYAGKAGRTEIIAHGTTIDPGFYSGASYFPFTPSLGCLTTKELWSLETGKIVESDQIKLMNAFKEAGADNGYFVVINIDDKQSPVRLTEFITFLSNEESK